VLEVRGRVLWLERRVRDERIEVLRPHHFRGAGERGVDVAVLAEISLRGAFRQLSGPRRKTDGALLRGRMIFPRDAQLLPRVVRQPPVVGDDGDATKQTAE